MQFKNTSQGFGIIAIFLHWIMAVLIIGLLCLGLYMTRIAISLQKLKLYGWHKELGILILMLVILRIIWRLKNVTPSLAELPYLERIAARSMHLAFYGFMVVLPITGWTISSAAGLPVSFFGLFILPDFVSPNEHTRLLFIEIHKWLAYGLIAALAGHVGAAFKHHFIDKDDILRRIFWP